jgi:glycosyltransferase involved in cell wall biosynthesis
MNKEKYDIILVSFSDLKVDARTLNLLRVLTKHRKDILTITISDKSEEYPSDENGIKHFYIEQTYYRRTWRKWNSFINSAKPKTDTVEADIVIACDLYSLPIAARIAGKNPKTKLIYDSREIYSALGNLHNKKLKQSVISFIEKYYIKRVNRIITSGELDSDYLAEYLDFPRSKIHEVYNYPPYKEAVNSNIIREHFHIPNNQKIILYQGVILEGRGIKKILRAIKQIPEAVFCVIGDGPYMEELKKDISRRGIENEVFLTGRIEYDELHYWTCSADMGTALFEPFSLSYQFSLPNKIFEYCRAHIPTLATDLPAIRKVNEKAKIAALINQDFNDNEMIDLIYQLLFKELKYEIIDNCHNYAKDFSYEAQEDNIINIINSK